MDRHDRPGHGAHRDPDGIGATVGNARRGFDPLKATPAWDLGLALELLREERFTEALEMMQRLPRKPSVTRMFSC